MDKAEARELIKQIHSAVGMLGKLLEGDQEEAPLVTEPAPEPEPAPSYLIVGKAAAPPGQTATVEILGQTSQPVQGFGAYIGCPSSLELIGHEVAPELIELIGLDDPEDVVKQAQFGGIGDFLSVMLAFFGQVTDVVPPGTGNVKRTMLEARLPPMTPLLRLRFRIPASAGGGRRYHLDNTSWKYGRKIDDGRGNKRTLSTRNEFGTSKEVSSTGIQPVCISGWVDVL